MTMLGASNDFYNFVEDAYPVFDKEEGITLKSAWEMYKTYCDDAKVAYPFPQRVFKEELKNYFRKFEDRHAMDDDTRVRNFYSGFRTEKFETVTDIPEETELPVIAFESQPSIFDTEYADCPAQYATDEGTPFSTMATFPVLRIIPG